MLTGSRTAARVAVTFVAAIALPASVAGSTTASVAGATTASVAGATTAGAPRPPTMVRIGRRAPTTATGPTATVAANLRMHIAVTLRPRSAAALNAFAQAVSTPGSPLYRHFLTPGQFARRFGATATQIGTVRSALRARGLRPGPASAGGLSIAVTASAGTLARAFAISLRRVALPDRRWALSADAAPALASTAAADVQSVVGLDTTSAPQPLFVAPDRHATHTALTRAHVATGGPQPCAAARFAAPGQFAYTIDQIASAYGFAGLYSIGDTGAGTTIALYELEPDDPADIAVYQSCYDTHAAVAYVHVDGGAGVGQGSGEAALDIENTIGLVPSAKLLVYQGPNANSGAPGSGPYDIFSSIVNQDRANVVGVSWGECEAALGASDAAAENTLFQQAAAQGQTVVAAAGDSGAEDCDAPGEVPDTRVAVDDPASQPFVTGVGGTSLTSLGPPPTETVWHTAAAPISGALSAGAGGGGVSAFWPMPAAQTEAAAGLAVDHAAAAAAACRRASGYCREVPDVAADADPNTAYEIYWNGSGSVIDQPTGWQGLGGTSGAGPVWAALMALADSLPACAGSPVGYADPALYRAASIDYQADFHDVQTGNNDFTATNGGQFAAAPGYDLATGLGSPDATPLAGSLCADTVRWATIDAKLSAARSTITARVRATDVIGRAITYAARGLPPGLALRSSTGDITGRPTRQGRYTVQLSARDQTGSTATTSFAWSIGGAAQLSRVSLSSTSPRLTFSVSTARNAPPITTLRIPAPHGLAFHSVTGIRIDNGRRAATRQRFSAQLIDHGLLITLRRSTSQLRVTIAAPAVTLLGGRGSRIRGTRLGALDVRVGDAGGGTSELSAGL